MISLCFFARDPLYLNANVEFFDKWAKKYDIKYEVCVGDNSSNLERRKQLRELADEYIYISDKQVFRMGIPFCHNIVASIANSYKIFYLDSDEFPVFVNPRLEKMYDEHFVVKCVRADFFTPKEMKKINDFALKHPLLQNVERFFEGKELFQQDRLYNCRYAKFEGLCHSIFWVPQNTRSKEVGAVILHDSLARKVHKREEYTNPIIYEQYARQNRNPFLSSSETVLSWGAGKDHQYKDWKEFVKKCRR